MIPELLQDPSDVIVPASVCPPEIQLEALMFRRQGIGTEAGHLDWKGNTSRMRLYFRRFLERFRAPGPGPRQWERGLSRKTSEGASEIREREGR
jgi:hypothetical protein